ncbi:hypothetical protein VTK26DRAFT_8879 [Humicola hyalothermophila]
MLVTRHAATEPNPWSKSKFDTAFHKSTEGLRMSNNFDTVTQSDWQGQYSFLPPGENTIFPQSYEHVTNSNSENSETQAQPRSATAPNITLEVEAPKAAENSPLGNRLDPLGLRRPKQPSPIPEQPENLGEQYAQKAAETAQEGSLAPAETSGMSPGSNPLNSMSSTGQGTEAIQSHAGNEDQINVKEEDEVAEDEDMIEGEAEGESQPQPQTAAERTAQRRKMKRFRLTHQQTRYLMSEFAKQPHPDAAHRERLSREIPGLSPRQVQVWFQNRRAKIKRLTADDRERMMKMRAVPEDFDSLSALHNQYGAVHPLGTPITSPVDLGGSPYADHMMRPLMVDVRRHDGEDHHLSPTGLSPAFGSMGFNPSAALSTPDILSPLSPTSTDRYGYSSHLSTTPLSVGPRAPNPFTRQGSLDSGMGIHSHHARQQIRPLQPLQLRDTMTRSRSNTLQSPLRSGMSWKGDAIDYTTYHGGNSSPQIGSRQHGLYGQDQVGGNSAGGLGPYDSTSYSAGPTVQSPTHMSYPNFQSSSMQSAQSRGSRLRAASASLPLGLDLRTQYRSGIGSGSLQSAAHSPNARTASTPHLGAVSSSGYTASFPSAPLTAPVDFRTGFRSTAATTDYSMPQMSAPIAPPTDFSQAFQASMSASGASRTPMRDTFGGGGGGGGGVGPLGLGPQSQSSADRADDYAQDPLGMKRKRSFTGPPSTNPGTGAYGAAP